MPVSSKSSQVFKLRPIPAALRNLHKTAWLACGMSVALSNPAWANPQGGTVAAGQATVTQTSPSQVTVRQTTDRAIINWNSFSIGAGEHTRFVQPSASSITLNRVTGNDPSQILGRLSANGQIVLVNPNGVFFGKNSQVDVAALIASTHDIRNDDFMAGRLKFTLPGKPGAQVINQGNITVQEGGLVALVAPSVQNSGLIAARLGKVVLASANSFTIDLYGDNLILFGADSQITGQLKDAFGNPLSAAVENSGGIEANGGWVLLTADVAKNVVDKAINMDGYVKAQAAEMQSGTIVLKSDEGNVKMTGTLDASAPHGGDGGFIETSGAHVAIDPAARITTAAPFGRTGHWLIDPTDYIIAASGGDITGADLAAYLANTNVEVQTAASGGGNGDIWVNDGVTWNTLNKLTLTAHRHIYVNEAINGTGGGSVKLRADAEGTGTGTVYFGGNGHITVNNGGSVGIYYNPLLYTDIATRSDANGNPYGSEVTVVGDTQTTDYPVYGSAITLATGSHFTAYMLVNDVNQLQAINTNLSGRYALGKDIDAAVTSGWNGGAGFAPLKPFLGIFNGQGHTISGLTINRPSESGVGLFGIIGYSGMVSNVGLFNVSVTGYRAVGGLAGDSTGGIIGQSYSTGTVTGNAFIGGLLGQNVGGIIYRSYAAGDVTGVTGSGGVVSQNIGGLVGFVSVDGGLVIQSYATGSVSGEYRIGGLVGDWEPSNAYSGYSGISQSYATGSVTGSSSVGGLVGANNGVVYEAYAAGAVTGNSDVGGLLGTNSGIVSKSFWDIDSTGMTTSAGGVGLHSAEARTQAAYVGFDFTNTWQIPAGTASRPVLKVSSPPSVTVLTPGGSPSSLTPEQTLLIQQHQNDSVFQLLLAIADGLFTNSNQDLVWVGLYQNGAATAVQVEANRLRNIYDAYTAPQLFSMILSGQLHNDPDDIAWHSIYRNGAATAAQVAANKMWNVYDTYKNAPGTALFNGIVNGDLHNTASDSVWQALASTNLSATNKATQLATTYNTYKNADVETLVTALISKTLVAGDNAVWVALQSNKNRDTAFNEYKKANESFDAQYERYLKYANASINEILVALKGGDLVAGNNHTWALLSQNPNRNPAYEAYKKYLAMQEDPCKVSQACKPEERESDPSNNDNQKRDPDTSSTTYLPPLDPEFMELFADAFVENLPNTMVSNILGSLPLADVEYWERFTTYIAQGRPVTTEELGRARDISRQILQHLERIKEMYGPNPPEAFSRILDQWQAKQALLESDAWIGGGSANSSELKNLAKKSVLAGGVDLYGKALDFLETEKLTMDLYQRIANGENVSGAATDLVVNAAGYNPIVGPVLAGLSTVEMIADINGAGVQDTLDVIKSIVTNQNTMFASQVDTITTLLAQNKISTQEAQVRLSQLQATANSSLNDAMQNLATPGFVAWMVLTSNKATGDDIRASITDNMMKITQISVDDLKGLAAQKMLLTAVQLP